MTCLHTQHMEAIELLARKARSLSVDIAANRGIVIQTSTRESLDALAAKLEALAEMALCPFYDRAFLLQAAIQNASDVLATTSGTGP